MIRTGFSSIVLLGLVPTAALLPQDAQAAGLLSQISHHAGLWAFAVCAGLCLREVGLVRRENAIGADIQCLSVFLVSSLAFGALGFSLATSADQPNALWHGVIGSFGAAAARSGFARSGALTVAVAALAAQAVSGALAERVRLLPLLIFAALFASLLFPITLSWQSGWLARAGFVDYAGATFIHCAAGSAALAGVIVLGARIGRFDPTHKLEGREHHSFVLAGLGTLLVLIGWQGLVTGLLSTLPISLTSRSLSHVLAVLNVAAATGAIIALAGGFIWHRPRVLTIAFNGLVAGLVAISADPAHPSLGVAILIGGVAGALAALVPLLLEQIRLDDVTGAIPTHLCAGIWGTVAVLFSTPGAHLLTQIVGTAAVVGVTFVAAFVLFFVLQILLGLRKEAERARPAARVSSSAS